MRNFPHVSFQVKWLPFFLAPYVPEEGVKLVDYLEEKYGIVEIYQQQLGTFSKLAKEQA